MDEKQVTVPEAISDASIIDRVIRGEKDSYALIIRRYNQRLYRTGMSILNDDAETEDAMQVAYINAYENLSKFAHRSSFSTWLTKILVNECILRLKKRQKSINMNDENLENFLHRKSGTPDPASTTINLELKKLLEDSIRKLPEIYRSVFILREIEDMSIAETGECLDISGSNVKVRLNRAKLMLRNELLQQYKKEDILHFQLMRCDRMVGLVMAELE